VSKKDKNQYYDDCPVCLAQQKADDEGRDITMDELMDAMREAKKQGGIVGGLPEGEN